MLGVAIGLLFFYAFSMNNILVTFYKTINEGLDITPWIETLNLICRACGMITFGVAVMEGDMPIRESFKILVIVYLFIYVL